MKHPAIIAAALTAIALHSCFTGIESTPRITAGEVRRQSAAKPTPEMLFLADILPEPPAEWHTPRIMLSARSTGARSMVNGISRRGRAAMFSGDASRRISAHIRRSVATHSTLPRAARHDTRRMQARPRNADTNRADTHHGRDGGAMELRRRNISYF